MKPAPDCGLRLLPTIQRLVAILLLLLGGVSLARAGDITGAGSTFVYPSIRVGCFDLRWHTYMCMAASSSRGLMVKCRTGRENP